MSDVRPFIRSGFSSSSALYWPHTCAKPFFSSSPSDELDEAPSDGGAPSPPSQPRIVPPRPPPILGKLGTLHARIARPIERLPSIICAGAPVRATGATAAARIIGACATSADADESAETSKRENRAIIYLLLWFVVLRFDTQLDYRAQV